MKKKNLLLGYVILFICVVISVVITILFSNKGTSLIINLIFAGTMFFIILHAMGRIRKFTDLVNSLTRGTAYLDSLTDEQASKIRNGSEVFNDNEKLASLLTKYYKENDGYDGEISDYINEELLDDEIKKQVTELIAGAMTGLGLLGTFIGFMVGIKDLNLNQDELFGSIKTLMDGMKTAFLTSIFGVIYSLVFNWYFKYICSWGREELNSFYEAFYDKVASNPENRNVNLMVDYQRRQVEELEKLPLTIASTIAEEINKVFAPTINKMDSLMESFVDVATVNQQEGLGKLVNAFVDSMNEILNDKFVLLGETLDRTCQLQQSNFEMMEKVVSTITAQAAHLSELNESVEKSLENIQEYESKIEKFNENIINHNNETHKLITEILKSQNTTNDIIRDFTDNVTDLAQINKETADNFDKIHSITSEAVDNMQKQVAEFTNASLNLVNEIKTVGSRIRSECSGLEESLGSSLNSTFKVFDSNLAEITTHLNSSIKEMQELVDRLPVDLGTSIGKLRSSMNECVSLLNEKNGSERSGKK